MATDERFGSFFRSRRKALSPTLREFCRRNGFDPANVSRLERGLVPPPQAGHLLVAYAKALKLEEGTVDWDRFFELAAAETGRIPADVLEAKQKLPGWFLQMRAEAQGQSGWVKARHLEKWADMLDARGTLPELLRRLVRATGRAIRHVEFPSQEQTQRPGWDGIVEAGAGDEFVPEGTSGWEMGVDKDVRQKIKEDLGKRTKSSLSLDPTKTTFVFVTPRKWQKKSGRVKEIAALGAWKEVRVYDSASLEEWLEQSPAVDVWLAERLGLKPEGAISFDDYWANLQALTEPSLKPEVFLASRGSQIKELEGWLDGPGGILAIESKSPGEAIDFVAAFSREPKRADLFAARALIVEDRSAWRRLAASSGGRLLLVPHPSLSIEPELVAEVVRKGNRVLLPSGQAQREQITTIPLARTYRYDLERALESSGIERQTAQRRARESGGSLTVLKRLLGRYPGTVQPEWSRPQEASLLVPTLLAGGWNESFDGDREAVERIANRPYTALSEITARWLKEPDSPITRVGSRVSLVSREDSWFLLARNISQDELSRFELVALDVLSEEDRSFELPPERRWEASFQKQGPKYSPVLRQGLAETLALLGSRPNGLPDTAGTSPRVEHVVRKLLDGQVWLRWASLSDQLPHLAEAGPEAFLEAIERDLKRKSPAMNRVFEQGGNPVFTSMPHTGVLWALEVLSWNRDLLARVSLVLAELDARKLPRQAGNTPFRCLSEIFMPWFPQTTAPVEERVGVLRMLMSKRPGIGWRLLFGLLANPAPMATEIHRPSWRNWALAWSPGVTSPDYWYQVNGCAELLVEGMGDNPERWKKLIEHAENLPAASYRQFLARLSASAEKVNDEDIRRDVSDTIREKVAWHRQLSTANWALSEGELARLEEVQLFFEPHDAVRKIAWLFGPRWKALERLGNKEAQIDADRRAAVEGIVDQEGWQGILRLIQAVEAPDEVGAVVAEMQLGGSDSRILPGMVVSTDEKVARFARGYVWRRVQREGWDWVEGLNLRRWSTEEAGQLLLALSFERTTWQFVDQLGNDVSTWYWQRTRACTGGQDKDNAEYVVGKFLEHKKASSALGELRLALHHKHVFATSLLMDVLQTWLNFEMQNGDANSIHGVKYGIDMLFQELQKTAEQPGSGEDIKRLAKLEWACLALLDGHPSSPVILHRLLSDEPGLFVDVLGLCFRPRDTEPKNEAELTEQDRQAAQNAYRLLMSWQNVPGSRDAGMVDEERLLAWTNQARSLAKQRGLLGICEERIGQVLAYAPHESDGSWPCIPVRDALEEIGTEAVFGGFEVGIYNKRGMFSKTPREGGAQERKLADEFRAFADACKLDWPETAAALRRVASGYDEHANREDLAVESEQ